jgi:PEP-CTERM motif
VLENEWTTDVGNSAALRAAATTAVGGGWANQGVSVLNLFYRDGRPAQDQLTYTPGSSTQVPEPASLLLLGSALAGAAAFRKRRRR